jgi:hypothetical protein
MEIKEIGWEGTDWITRAQDRDKFQALLNMVMTFLVP